VLTHRSRTDRENDVEAQDLTPIASLANDLLSSIVVKGPWPEETSRAPRRKGAAPKARKTKRKKGGWRALKGLRWTQVKAVFECDKLAKDAGLRLNAFITIKADWRCSTDQERKRDISRKIAHLGQKIKGRGRTPHQIHFVAATVYEKERAGVLHAHVLAHVSNFGLARQISDGDTIDIRAARREHLAYITKQRLPFRPEIEATHWHRRQASEKIVGARISFSADAKALIAAQRFRSTSKAQAARSCDSLPEEIRAA
jgi:hypothetical protein